MKPVLTDDWAKSHLILQQDHMVGAIRQILERYVPAERLSELKDKFAMVCRPLGSGATVIRPELLAGLHVVVLSVHLIPKSTPPLNFPREHIALVLLHELAHVHLGHRPPATDQMEEQADAVALEWFNTTQGTKWKMQDLANLRKRLDRFWLFTDRDPTYEPNSDIQPTK